MTPNDIQLGNGVIRTCRNIVFVQLLIKGGSILSTDLELLLRDCLGRYFVIRCFEAFSTAK